MLLVSLAWLLYFGNLLCLRLAVFEALHVLKLKFVAHKFVLPIFRLVAGQMLRQDSAHNFALEAAHDRGLAAVGLTLVVLLR